MRHVIANVEGTPSSSVGTVIGLNLGKNKDTPLENAAEDYIALMRTFAPLADYLAINISSPNTVGLRRLQGREMLEGLLGAISAGTFKARVSMSDSRQNCPRFDR
jgi:dihydroorotate dehydrogenase